MASISIPVAAVGADAAASAAAGAGAAAATAGTAAAAGAAGLTAATAADVAASSAAALAGTAAPAAVAAAGGSLFTIGNVAAGLGAAGSLTSAYGAHMQGVATSNMDKQKARVEAISAQQKQIDMRQKMLSSLASQNAGTLGSVGTGRGTGFGANAMRQITQNQNDLMANQANESAQVSLLDQAGSNAAAAGNLSAGGDLVGGAGNFMKNFNG